MSATRTHPEATRTAIPEPATRELERSFDCFGSRCAVHAGPAETCSAGVDAVKGFLFRCHDHLSRFIPDSELSRLNADPRTEVPASPLLCEAVAAALDAAELTDGLVDPTMLGAIEEAGYRESRAGIAAAPLTDLLAAAPERRPARPAEPARWRQIRVDRERGVIERPPGLGIDLGGTAKGWAADRSRAILAGCPSLAVDCAGDLRIAQRRDAAPRTVTIAAPDSSGPLGTLELRSGGIATSGLGRRAWIGENRSAHHLIDPATGRPCFSGVVQASALAPTALEAEARAKAALLSGPVDGPQWLAHGGVLVTDEGRVIEVGIELAPPTTEMEGIAA